jgi:diacylglycerol kinase family enzyme
MRVTLIHNPRAGDDTQPTTGQLQALIREAGHKVRVQSVKEEGWSASLKKSADIVVVAGGDGTVGKVARRLIGRDIPLAILPLGTANNISKTLGIADLPVTRLIPGWSKARAVKFDAGVAVGPWGTRYFIEGVGLGFLPFAIPAVQANPTMESLTDANAKVTYALQIMRERLGDHEALSLKASIDGKDISGEYVLFEVMNMKYVGPNLYLAPDLLHNNGMFEVVCVERKHRKELQKILAHWQEGGPWPAEFVTHSGRNVLVEWTGFPLHLDDKLWPAKNKKNSIRPPAPIELEVLPKALCFLVPREVTLHAEQEAKEHRKTTGRGKRSAKRRAAYATAPSKHPKSRKR